MTGQDVVVRDRAYACAERGASVVVPISLRQRVAAWRLQDIPKPLLCVPLVAHYLWLALRHRSLTLPSAVNPSIETGGMVGESKAGCMAQIGAGFAGHVAAWRLVGKAEDALAAKRLAGLDYPLIAKPDIGWCGYGVRKIRHDAELLAYAAAFPPGGRFMLQRLAREPNEAGLFYVREPGAAAGRLLAVTLRHMPHVVGDGETGVTGLINRNPALRRHAAYYAASLGPAGAADVPGLGERVMLTTIASLRAGAWYEDASASITGALEAQLDAIAGSMRDFHFGRFDVRFASMAALRAGRFTIIEVNGAGAEAIHFWDPRIGMVKAFAGVFAKQAKLFAMGAAMRARGHRPVGPIALASAWLKQMSLVRSYPASD